jgi:uncharacterized protein
MTSPTAPAERIQAIDALRGIALCGILLINIPLMAGPIAMERPIGTPSLTDPDWQTWTIAQLFVFGTARGLFSMLFGIGLMLFFGGAGDRRRLYLRRLALLFGFGVVNGTLLLWPGDILTTYALAGLCVIGFRGSQPYRLLIAGGIALGLLTMAMAIEVATMPAELGLYTPDMLARESAARLGSYADSLVYLSKVTWVWTVDPATVLWTADASGFMLIGMALWRMGLFAADARPPRGLAACGYAIGLTLRIAQVVIIWHNDGNPNGLTALIDQPARLAMTLGHVGLFLTLWRRVGAAGAFVPLAHMGRMALTLYLGQSLMAAIVFEGFGLGLWGKLNGWGEWAVAAAILAAQAIFASLWFARYRYGPAEWLWRWGTYGARPKLT